MFWQLGEIIFLKRWRVSTKLEYVDTSDDQLMSWQNEDLGLQHQQDPRVDFEQPLQPSDRIESTPLGTIGIISS